MRHKAVKELFHYWNDLRGDRAAPERNDMDPNAIRHILADTFLLDIDPDRRFPFRLAGTRVNALFDAEQKGRSFLDLWRAEEAHNIATILLTVADGACPVVAGAVGSPAGEDEVPLELLFLPIRHYGKTHARILGIITAMKKPAWLGTLPLGPVTLRSLRVVDHEDEPAAGHALRDNQPVHTGRDRRAAMLGEPVRQPFLQVIEGGGQSSPRSDLGRPRPALHAAREETSR